MNTYLVARWAKMALVLFSVLVIQVGVVADLPAFGAVGDLMLLTAIATGSVGGPNRGALYGFCAGLAYDLMLDTPFGLTALVYAVVGYAVGVASGWYLEPRAWYHLTVAALASVVAVALMVGVALVLGLRYPLNDVVRAAAVMVAWNAVLILPARRLLRWAIGEDEPDRFRMAYP